MRAFGLLTLALVAATPAAADGVRVAEESYVPGPGDLICQVGNFACALFYVEGGESRVHVAIDDSTGRSISFNLCSPDCATEPGTYFCGEGTLEGIVPGDLLIVFLHNIPDMCPFLGAGAPTTGMITATFS